MLKRSQSERIASPCWNNDTRTQTLRVELLNGDAFIFPYLCLIDACHQRRAGQETLTLVFSRYEVKIEGRSLGEIAEAIQQFSVESVKPLSSRYGALNTSGLVETITVIERPQ